MRRTSWLCIALFALCVSSFSAVAGEKELDPRTAGQLRAFENLVDELQRGPGDRSPDQRAVRGESINQAFVLLTGEAVNPLFGVTALGMYNYFRTDEAYREYLPIYDQPLVWLPLLGIILLMLFNSTICEAFPPLKIPLNALGDVVNKAGAIAVLPLVIKMFADAVAGPMTANVAQAAGWLFPAAYAAEGGMAAAAWPWIGWIAGAVVGTFCYIAVWLTFNVIDVLILICPFPGVDATLKAFRLSVIGALAGSYQLSPEVSLALAIGLTVVSFFVAGWSFRLSLFGWFFSTDILFFRRRETPAEYAAAFSTDGMHSRHRLPMRTFGRLEKDGSGGLKFSYRPWLIRARRSIDLGPAERHACGKGLFNPFLVANGDAEKPLLRLPPRYRGAEDALAQFFSLSGVVDCGMAVSVRKWFAAQFGGKEATIHNS